MQLYGPKAKGKYLLSNWRGTYANALPPTIRMSNYFCFHYLLIPLRCLCSWIYYLIAELDLASLCDKNKDTLISSRQLSISSWRVFFSSWRDEKSSGRDIFYFIITFLGFCIPGIVTSCLCGSRCRGFPIILLRVWRSILVKIYTGHGL